MDEREKNINGNDGDEYDKVCYVCRRPESKAGKMITLPGGIDICRDCMQKAFDTVMNSGFDMSRLSGITPEQLWNAGMPMGMWQNIPGKGGSAGTGNAGEKKAEDQTGGGLPENGEKKETAPKTPGTPEDVPEETAVVYQPVKNIYLAASAAMDMFRALDALDTIRLSGTDADGWYIKEAREAMKSGKILYAGKYSFNSTSQHANREPTNRGPAPHE